MKNKTGLLILIVLIAIPLIWVLLWKKSDFQYTTLPIYSDVVMGDTVPLRVDTFTLWDQNGNRFTRDSIGDRIYVANFFFASCPDVCPQMNSNLKLVAEKFKNNPGVVFISHSVDPENDTVEALSEYAKEFAAENNAWYFLTGSKRSIYDLAAESYRLVAVQEDKDAFIHSEKLILVDKDFRIRGYYEGRDYKDIMKLEDDIPFLLKLYKEGKEDE